MCIKDNVVLVEVDIELICAQHLKTTARTILGTRGSDDGGSGSTKGDIELVREQHLWGAAHTIRGTGVSEAAGSG